MALDEVTPFAFVGQIDLAEGSPETVRPAEVVALALTLPVPLTLAARAWLALALTLSLARLATGAWLALALSPLHPLAGLADQDAAGHGLVRGGVLPDDDQPGRAVEPATDGVLPGSIQLDEAIDSEVIPAGC